MLGFDQERGDESYEEKPKPQNHRRGEIKVEKEQEESKKSVIAIDKLKIKEEYRDLIPKPAKDDLERLKEDIERMVSGSPSSSTKRIPSWMGISDLTSRKSITSEKSPACG
jgi:hypothetical protein